MKKIEKSAKIKVEIEKCPSDIYGLLDKIFWKEHELVNIAVNFLMHIKEWEMRGSPYKVTEWKNYCIRKNLSQSKYHNILRRLKRVGMIKKSYNKTLKVHEIKLSKKFSDYLFSLERIWDDFCKS